MAKWVYSFGDGEAEGKAEMRNLLGGKGANLAEMANLGLPVPPGFTITTEVCTWYYANGRTYPADLIEEMEAALARVEKITGKVLGGDERPLLLSVRSGARASMPGMMDTILNLGLNDRTVELLAASADKRFAYDSFRRFIQMYSNVVLDIDHHTFEERLEDFKDERGYTLDTELTGDDWAELVRDYKVIVERESGAPFPEELVVFVYNTDGGGPEEMAGMVMLCVVMLAAAALTLLVVLAAGLFRPLLPVVFMPAAVRERTLQWVRGTGPPHEWQFSVIRC